MWNTIMTALTLVHGSSALYILGGPHHLDNIGAGIAGIPQIKPIFQDVVPPEIKPTIARQIFAPGTGAGFVLVSAG